MRLGSDTGSSFRLCLLALRFTSRVELVLLSVRQPELNLRLIMAGNRRLQPSVSHWKMEPCCRRASSTSWLDFLTTTKRIAEEAAETTPHVERWLAALFSHNVKAARLKLHHPRPERKSCQ